jgi:hypothetical protein
LPRANDTTTCAWPTASGRIRIQKHIICVWTIYSTGTNTITLARGATFTLTAVNNTTDGPTGLPVIAANNKLTILGNGATKSTSSTPRAGSGDGFPRPEEVWGRGAAARPRPVPSAQKAWQSLTDRFSCLVIQNRTTAKFQ